MSIRAIIHPLFYLLLFSSCSNGGGSEKASIQGTIEGGEGETLHFMEFRGRSFRKVDSTSIQEDGSFKFPNYAKKKDFYFLGFSQNEQMVLITDSTENITVNTERESLQESAEVKGSEDSERLYDYFAKLRPLQKEMDSLQQKLRSGGNKQAVAPRIQKVQERIQKMTRDFIDKKPESPANIIAGLSALQAKGNKKLLKKVHQDLEGEMGHSLLHTQLGRKVKQAEKRAQQQKRQKQMEKARSGILEKGKEAPELEMQTPNGGTKALSDLEGKVVLIDFWASWCKPCIKELPELKKVYRKYNDQGFEILGVSLDKRKNDWTKAIEKHDMNWVHISDLQFWNSAATEKYKINSIPFTVLVDREGKVIAKGLRAHQLEDKLKEVLG